MSCPAENVAQLNFLAYQHTSFHFFIFTFIQECISWKQESCEGGGADRRIGHTVTYDTEKKVLYVYGGSKTKRWFSDVNILDLHTNTWSAVKVCLFESSS